VNYFNEAMSMLSKGVLAAGSLLTIWGLVQLGLAIKDSNGPGMQHAILQAVGGGIIVAAAAWFTNITL
jgi:hypothetical protein